MLEQPPPRIVSFELEDVQFGVTLGEGKSSLRKTVCRCFRPRFGVLAQWIAAGKVGH